MKKREARQIPAAIQWHDGMLLEPQQFQEAARRSERLLDYHLAQLAPYHYGVVGMEIDRTALLDGLLCISKLEAVLPDGLVVVVRDDDGLTRSERRPLKIDLTAPAIKRLLAGSEPVEVHLAVASEASARGETPRYDDDAVAPAADELGGPSIESVPRLVPHATLVVPKASSTSESARVSMPIVRVKYDSRGYEICAYEPPRLAVTAGSPISTLCANEIVLLLREKAGRLASAALALSDSAPVAWQRKVRLQQQVASLVAALPPLEALLDTGGAHPFAVYLAATAVIGQNAAASASLLPPKLSDYPYEHEELTRTFERLSAIVKRTCAGILESFEPYVLRYDRDLRRYQVDLPAGFRERRLAIGVRPFEARAGAELAGWMNEARIGVESRLPLMPYGRSFGAPRRPRSKCDDVIRQELREIVAPDGGDVYWLDGQGQDLEGQGPLVVLNVGDAEAASDRFQLTLYVSNEPIATGARSA